MMCVDAPSMKPTVEMTCSLNAIFKALNDDAPDSATSLWIINAYGFPGAAAVLDLSLLLMVLRDYWRSK
jgi:hypothetical protein